MRKTISSFYWLWVLLWLRIAQLRLGHLRLFIIERGSYDLVCDLILKRLRMLYIGVWMLGLGTDSDENAYELCIHPTSYGSIPKVTNRGCSMAKRRTLLMDMGNLMRITYRKRDSDDQALYDTIRREVRSRKIGETNGSR